MEDRTHLICPLHVLGLAQDEAQIQEWLRAHEVTGETLWHRRGLHRSSRYLLSHTCIDSDSTVIDLDVLLYLTAKSPTIMVWEGSQSHSLAQWIRIHGITPARWYNYHQRQQHWALGPDGIMDTLPPIDRISYLIRSLVRVIRSHHPGQGTTWTPPGQPWTCPTDALGQIRALMGTGVRVNNSPTGVSFTEGTVQSLFFMPLRSTPPMDSLMTLSATLASGCMGVCH